MVLEVSTQHECRRCREPVRVSQAVGEPQFGMALHAETVLSCALTAALPPRQVSPRADHGGCAIGVPAMIRAAIALFARPRGPRPAAGALQGLGVLAVVSGDMSSALPCIPACLVIEVSRPAAGRAAGRAAGG